MGPIFRSSSYKKNTGSKRLTCTICKAVYLGEEGSTVCASDRCGRIEKLMRLKGRGK